MAIDKVMDKKLKKKLQQKAKSRGIEPNGYERHVFFCGGPSCCDLEDGKKVFRYLQKRLSKLEKSGRSIYCTRANCLRFCRGGPLLVVYPEGVWYADLDEEACERVIEEHLLEGRVVDEYSIACNPLTPLDEQAKKKSSGQ